MISTVDVNWIILDDIELDIVRVFLIAKRMDSAVHIPRVVYEKDAAARENVAHRRRSDALRITAHFRRHPQQSAFKSSTNGTRSPVADRLAQTEIRQFHEAIPRN